MDAGFAGILCCFHMVWRRPSGVAAHLKAAYRQFHGSAVDHWLSLCTHAYGWIGIAKYWNSQIPEQQTSDWGRNNSGQDAAVNVISG
jgi:hypothetical protein